MTRRPTLPSALLDAKAIQRRLGITRAAAEAMMRHLPIVRPDGIRKVYVREEDLAAAIERWTHQQGDAA